MSSWRQRLALANGFRLFPVALREVRSADMDLSPSQAVLTWLEDLSGVTSNDLEELTLRNLDGHWLKFSNGRAAPRWVIPLHGSRRDRGFSMQFCPLCLGSDAAEPYFRLKWRLSIQTWCHVHQVLFLEECPNCGHPAWPASSVITSLYRKAVSYDLKHCQLCAEDLSLAATQKIDLEKSFVPGDLGYRKIAVDSDVGATTLELHNAMWLICQFFIRTQTQRLIASKAEKWRFLVEAISKSDVKTVDYLPTALRHELINEVATLFESWPDRMVEFCHIHDISAMHFSSAREDLPRWFLKVISSKLARQVRGITSTQVQEAKKSLSLAGKKISKESIGRAVGSRNVRAVVESLPARTRATEEERKVFLESLMAYVDEPCTRASSSEVRVRDASILMAAILLRLPISEVLKFTGDDVHRLVLRQQEKVAGDERFKSQAIGLLAGLLEKYRLSKNERSRKRPMLIGAPFFEGFRGGISSVRAVHMMLLRSMVTLDPLLCRASTVFESAFE